MIMKTFFIRQLLLFAAAVAAVAGQPAIEAIGQAVQISVGDGANVTISTFNPTTGAQVRANAVVTDDHLAWALEQSRGETLDLASRQVFEALTEVLGDIDDLRSANTAGTVAAELLSLRADIDTIQTTEIEALQTRLTRLEAAVFPNDTLACSEYPTLASGVAHGSGTGPGSIRVLTCNAGFVLTGSRLTGSQGTVVCNGNDGAAGAWSDAGASRCVSATVEPTVAPTVAPQLVSCCINADNFIFDVWVDGRRWNMNPPNAVGHGGVQSIQFPSTTRVLGVWAADGEAGCSMGHFLARCSTEAGNSKWDVATSAGSGWKVRTSRSGADDVRSFVDSNSDWLTPGWTDSAFVNATEQGSGTRGPNALRMMAPRFAAFNNGVCRMDDLVTPMHTICGGEYIQNGGNGAGRTDWLFRIEP
jgi:hypothetical protein